MKAKDISTEVDLAGSVAASSAAGATPIGPGEEIFGSSVGTHSAPALMQGAPGEAIGRAGTPWMDMTSDHRRLVGLVSGASATSRVSAGRANGMRRVFLAARRPPRCKKRDPTARGRNEDKCA